MRRAIANIKTIPNKFIRDTFQSELNKFLEEKFNEYKFHLYKKSKLKISQAIWDTLKTNKEELIVYLKSQDLGNHIDSSKMENDIYNHTVFLANKSLTFYILLLIKVLECFKIYVNKSTSF
jgi:hypothetical protein